MRRGLLVVVALAGCPAPKVPVTTAKATGGAIVRATPRTGAHAHARIGDLELFDGAATAIVIGAAPPLAGRRPLNGALIDVLARRPDGGGNDASSDPIEWWRIGWVSADAKLHVPEAARAVLDGSCARIDAEVDGVALGTRVCPLARGFSVHTDARGLAPGAAIADELQVATSDSLVDDDGGAWKGEHPTRWIAFSSEGVGVAIDTHATASREIVHWPDEIWPAPIVVRHGDVADRRVIVAKGDALDALAAGAADTITESVDLGPHGGSYALVAKGGRELFRGAITGRRTLAVPRSLNCDLLVRDADGLALGPPSPVGSTRTLAPAPRGALRLSTDQPVHVLFKGKGQTPDPVLASQPNFVGAGWSVYLLRSADIALPPGEYDVVATSGPLATLDRFSVTIEPGGRAEHRIGIAWVQHPNEMVAADFHLHAAPSRDSKTSIAERVASLVCEGVDVAVATDHNRVTDYGPALAALRLSRPAVVAGDEITMSGMAEGAQYGHFNVFPLPLPAGAPEETVPPYFDVPPDRVAPSARALGARVVQVNHARLEHSGFFDFAKLDAATGKAANAFSDDFDAMEVFNGFELERPEKLRTCAQDLVAFARRGKRIAATGNSDSHALLFQEPGYPRTWVRVVPGEASTLANRVIDGVLRGDTVASSGALLDVHVEGQPPGSIVRPKNGKVHVSVRAYAAEWVPLDGIEVWKDDSVAARANADPPRDGLRLAWETDIAVTRDAVILVWAASERPIGPTLPLPNARAVSVSTPVYVDADGDGRVISAAR
jgi:hypothetical protein